MKTFDDIEKKYPLTEEEENIINLKIELVKKLIELRKDSKLTQEALADLCHVKRSFIARIETHNTRSMKVETLIKLANGVGCEVKLVPKTSVL